MEAAGVEAQQGQQGQIQPTPSQYLLWAFQPDEQGKPLDKLDPELSLWWDKLEIPL